MTKVRTRFAPSPTGYLHMGSLRTVLFGYLIAKTESKDGKFILRIEDTDQKRKVEGAIEEIIKILDWIGIKFDEGPHINGDYGPYIQTQRLDIYNKYIGELLDKGEAYHCFCTSDRLEKMRADQQAQKLPPRYDRACRDLNKEEVSQKIKNGESHVIRQKMPLDGEVVVHDELRGDIKFKAAELEDHVLIKSDNIPTYQFASVIDDHLMEISHVLRGEEWIPSFPKNVLLYKNFGWEIPKFIHMSLTMNKGGGKLSKRQGDVSVEDFKAKGYLPEALINFNAMLGWHPKDEKEFFTLEELIKTFDYRDMGISAAAFDIEKLDYLNGYYIRQKSVEELTQLCVPYLENNLRQTKSEHKKELLFISKVVAVEQERLKQLSEIGELTEFFFFDVLNYDKNMLAWKKMSVADAQSNLVKMRDILADIKEDNWNKEYLEKTIIDYLKNNNLKIGEYLWPMRVALTGREASPGPFEVAEILGLKETAKRIDRAINNN
jgi:glutamyl-tRNA synthetase